jgi:hypothetical protein
MACRPRSGWMKARCSTAPSSAIWIVFTLPAAYPTNGAAGQTNPFTLFQGGDGLGAAAGSVVNRTTGSPANAYGGQFYPDIAANIRVDQAWGIFQLSGIAHYVNASYNFLDTATDAGAQGFSSPYGAGAYINCPASGASSTRFPASRAAPLRQVTLTANGAEP